MRVHGPRRCSILNRLQECGNFAREITSRAVAMLPSQVADQLHAQPGALESALERNSCQQRGVQTLQFQCTFNAEDGPQSLIVVPEATSKVPHKKAEVEMQAVKCVANCIPPPPANKQ